MGQGCVKSAKYCTKKKHCTTREHKKEQVLIKYIASSKTMSCSTFEMDKVKETMAGGNGNMVGNLNKGGRDVDKRRDCKSGNETSMTRTESNMAGKGIITGEGNMAGGEGNITGGEGNMAGGNITGGEGNMAGKGIITGEGNMAGEGNITGGEGNMAGEGNITGGEGNKAGGEGNIIGGKGNMAGGEGNITGGKGNMAGEEGNITGGEGNMAGGEGNITGGKGNMAGEGNITGGKGNMAGEEGNITGGEGNMAGGEGNITGGEGNMAGGEGNITGGKGNMAGEEGNITGGEGNMAGGEGNITGGEGNMAGGEGNITGGEGNMAGGEGNITGGKGNMAGGEGNITGRKGNMAGGEGNITGGEGNMAGGEGNITGGEGNMAGGEGNITGGKGNMAGEEGNITGGKGNMAGGEGNITGGEGNMAGGESIFASGHLKMAGGANILTEEEGNIVGKHNTCIAAWEGYLGETNTPIGESDTSYCAKDNSAISTSIPLIDLLLESDFEGEAMSKGGESDSDSFSDTDEDSDNEDKLIVGQQRGKDVYVGKVKCTNRFSVSSESTTESTDSTTPTNSPRRLCSTSDRIPPRYHHRESTTESTTTITPPSSQDQLDGDNSKRIPETVPKFVSVSDIKPKTILSPTSVDCFSVGSTLQSEYFTNDLTEDGVCTSRSIASHLHDVRCGSAVELEFFVQNKVYNAHANTGLLLNQEDRGQLKPHSEGGQSFYRQGCEYTLLEQGDNPTAIVVCEDKESGVKFVRKKRQRAKFQGQKKSVLVPLRHQNSPYIMDIYGVIVMEDDVYIFMEFCEGGPITHSQAWSVSDTCGCVREILECLVYMHQHGLVHGDIKPENICLRVENDVSSLCLIDFEFVRLPEEKPLFKGYTTQYLPPWWKDLETSRELLATMDLWATASIAVCLLTGKKPWSRKVKDLKKLPCSKCSTKTCTCDQLHSKLRQHIQDQGQQLLVEHLDTSQLQSDPTGQVLWQTLVFLTRPSAGVEGGAAAAKDILTGEANPVPEIKERRLIDVQISYKKRVLISTQVLSGTQVGEVLRLQDVTETLKTKYMLLKPKADHFIIDPCNIEMHKRKKTGIVSKIKRTVSIFRKDKYS